MILSEKIMELRKKEGWPQEELGDKVGVSRQSISKIIANNTGYVHCIMPMKPGMAIQKGQVIAEISKNQEELMLVEAYIEATDGTVVNAIKSMPVTARIVYEQETYLDWLLEMLSLKN